MLEYISLDFILIVLVAVVVFFVIQIGYWLILYTRLSRQAQVSTDNRDYPPVSIIIVAKDVAAYLRENLPSILEQDYPQFEVIVINDDSQDDTQNTLIELEQKYSNLRHTFTPSSARYVSHKKLAISLGVRASKYDWLTFTEPFCKPVSNQWLKMMASHFTPSTDIVLGYSNYTKAKGYFAHKITFDSLINQMRYLGAAIMNQPYMGNGCNMAYKKKLFLDAKGFSSHLDLCRGEDDLFINEIANSANTQVEARSESIMRIPMPENHQYWAEEKIQQIETRHYFKGIARYVMGFESFSRYLFDFTGLVGLLSAILTFQWILAGIFAGFFIIRWLIIGAIVNKTCKAFQERKFIFTLPWLLFNQPLHNLRFKLKWNSRRRSDFKRRFLD